MNKDAILIELTDGVADVRFFMAAKLEEGINGEHLKRPPVMMLYFTDSGQKLAGRESNYPKESFIGRLMEARTIFFKETDLAKILLILDKVQHLGLVDSAHLLKQQAVKYWNEYYDLRKDDDD